MSRQLSKTMTANNVPRYLDTYLVTIGTQSVLMFPTESITSDLAGKVGSEAMHCSAALGLHLQSDSMCIGIAAQLVTQSCLLEYLQYVTTVPT